MNVGFAHLRKKQKKKRRKGRGKERVQHELKETECG